MPDLPPEAAPLRVRVRCDRAGHGAVVELHPGNGVALKEEPGTLIWRERLADGTEAVIKLYRRGLLAWCRCRVTSFRTWNEFRALRQLESLGERCTPPLFWSHGHFGRYGWGEMLATQWLPDARPLADVLATDPERARRLDLAPLWSIAGRLHDAGLHHGTLLSRNVLVRGEGDALEFILLDLPRFHRFPLGIRGTRMARYDLLFLANTLLRALPADDLPRWLSAYGMSDDQQQGFAAHLGRFRNSSRLRRAVGMEFNVRALLAKGRQAFRRARPSHRVPVPMSSRIVQTTAAAAAILALLAPLFVIHLPTDRAWLRVSLDASHGPIFAAVAVILCAWLSSRVTHHEPVSWPDWPRCGQAFALTIVTGIVIEYLQSLQRRLPSSFDVATDAAGAAAGLAVWSLLTRSRGVGPPGRDRRMAWALVAIALAGITFVAWRPLHAVVAYANRAASFPSIAHFRSAQDLYFVTTNGKAAELVALPAPWAQREGERALRLTYDAKHAPAVQVVEPSPDWRGYSVIAADLTNAGDTEVRLTFRIHDAAHDWSHEDRMNLPLVLAPGTRTTVRVALAEVQAAPASRPMDLSRIANVMLFGAPAQPPGEIYVSRLWLE